MSGQEYIDLRNLQSTEVSRNIDLSHFGPTLAGWRKEIKSFAALLEAAASFQGPDRLQLVAAKRQKIVM